MATTGGGGGFSIEITGLKELETFINESLSPEEIKSKIQASVDAAFTEGYDMMQRDVPVRTGRLKRSISRTKDSGEGGGDILDQIEVSAPYAGFVNFGSNRNRPHPFATNAYNFIVETLSRTHLFL